MDALRQDLRFAFRLLAKKPGLTAIAVLSMALGVGVNTTAFGVLYGMLLRPLPYADPDRLVDLSMANPQVDGGYGRWSYPDYVDLRRASTVFAGIAAYRGAGSLILAGPEGPERIEIDAVSAGLFPLLGVDPIRGRHFRPEEDRPDHAPVLLLSHRLWLRRFHGDPGVVGRTVLANGKPHQVVGVMPPGFHFPENQEAWVPLETRWASGSRSARLLLVVARLEPGRPLGRAQAEVSGIARRLERRYPRSNAGWTAVVQPLRKRFSSPGRTTPLILATAAAGCVLLLACANLSSLLLAETGSRQRELAVRAALGASRGRIVRQLLTENVLLALAGGLLGALLSAWGLGAAGRALTLEPFWMRFVLDGPVLLFAFAVVLAAGLLFGLVPAVQSMKIELRRTLKEGEGNRRTEADGQRLRSALVIGEVALALVLLIATSLFARSFFELRNEDPGFFSAGVVSLWTTLQGDPYAALQARGRQAEQIAQRVAAVPGIEAAAVGPVPLFDSSNHSRIALEERAFALGREPAAKVSGVTSGYFRTLGVPILRGRVYTAAESAGGARMAVVNQAFVERFFPGVDVVGRRFRLLDAEEDGWLTIAGMAGDVKTDLWRPAEPQVYVPPRFEQLHSVDILVRSRLPRDELARRVWEAVRRVDPGLPLYQVETAEEVIDSTLAFERMVSQGFALFGAIALFLAAVGIYGALSCSVSHRLRELGVRIALGARRRHVLGLVLLRGLGLAASGIALGLAGAFAATRLLAEALYGVSPRDPASFLGIPLLLFTVALGACWVPARRAMDADPVEAIRSE
jgi:putative ABC transport system permease protein